jgi:hypothetical protein
VPTGQASLDFQIEAHQTRGQPGITFGKAVLNLGLDFAQNLFIAKRLQPQIITRYSLQIGLNIA